MTISERTREVADRLMARYPQPRSALLPLLYLVQSEEGHITAEGITFCADKVGLTKAETQAVQTFYEMYERDDPGDWLVTICVNFACKVNGAQRVYERMVEHLGGHDDRDNGVRVKHLECLGNCEDAPVVQVNYQNYERVSADEAIELLEACRRGDPPPASDGTKPPRFREVCWRLAGATDHPLLHERAVAGAQADMEATDEPPAERIFDTEKSLGEAGVHDSGPVRGDAGDLDEAPEAPAPAADTDELPDSRYPGSRKGQWGYR